jgi:Fe-S oxidoreductase
MRTEKEILADINEAKAKIVALQTELDAVVRKNREYSSNIYEKRKMILENAALVFAKILKPGDYVKVTGTRASPYREVKEISKDYLIGATCTFNKRASSIAKVNDYEIITCGTNKIIAVLRDSKWVTAKEVLAEYS